MRSPGKGLLDLQRKSVRRISEIFRRKLRSEPRAGDTVMIPDDKY